MLTIQQSIQPRDDDQQVKKSCGWSCYVVLATTREVGGDERAGRKESRCGKSRVFIDASLGCLWDIFSLDTGLCSDKEGMNGRCRWLERVQGDVK